MIYVANKITIIFMSKLLMSALNLNSHSVALWEYPNINNTQGKRMELFNAITQHYLGKRSLEVVTLYGSDDQRIKMADCYTFDREMIKILIDKIDYPPALPHRPILR